MDNVSHMASFRSSLEKLNLQLVSNIELFPTHTRVELSVLGIGKKVMKDVVTYGGGILKNDEILFL
jgi:hypothetical protein